MTSHPLVRGFGATIVATMVLAACGGTGTAVAKDGRNGALLGGAAAGVVGGILLNQAFQGNAQAAPPPPPQPVYVQPAPQPVYVQPAPVDRDFNRAERLHDQCDDGDRRACIQFGILIGQHREREAQWRRQNPDLFAWDRY